MKYWTKARKFLTRAKRLYPDGITFSQAQKLYCENKRLPKLWPDGTERPGGYWMADNMLMGKLLVCNAHPTGGSGCPGNKWIVTNTEPPYFTPERLAAGNRAAKHSKRVWKLRRLLAKQDELGIEDLVRATLARVLDNAEPLWVPSLMRICGMVAVICPNKTEFERCEAIAAHVELNSLGDLLVNGRRRDANLECPRCGAMLALPEVNRVKEVGT